MACTNCVTRRKTEENKTLSLTIVASRVYDSPQSKAGREMADFDTTLSACREYPTDWWYPLKGREAHAASRDAIRICFRCSVRNECLRYALEHETHGIWGGMRESEREIERRRRGVRLSPQALSAMSAQTMRVSRRLKHLEEESGAVQ